jgi:hypothetical protein
MQIQQCSEFIQNKTRSQEKSFFFEKILVFWNFKSSPTGQSRWVTFAKGLSPTVASALADNEPD